MAKEVAEHLDGLATEGVGQVIGRHAANQEFGDLARFQAAQPAVYRVDQADTDTVGSDLAFQDPVQRVFLGNDVR
ncbi:hypothetical protein D3C76_1666510 [compost metagenome]